MQFFFLRIWEIKTFQTIPKKKWGIFDGDFSRKILSEKRVQLVTQYLSLAKYKGVGSNIIEKEGANHQRKLTIVNLPQAKYGLVLV